MVLSRGASLGYGVLPWSHCSPTPLQRVQEKPHDESQTTLTPAQMWTAQISYLDPHASSITVRSTNSQRLQPWGARNKKHLSSFLVSNSYLSSFVQKVTKTRSSSTSREPVTQFKSTVVFPYVKGASESLRRCIQQQGIHAVFKSDTTLRLHLVRPQDIINPARQDSVLYRIPCECSKIYIRRNRKTYVREEERTREGIYVWPVPRPPPFLNTLTRPVIPALERSKVY